MWLSVIGIFAGIFIPQKSEVLASIKVSIPLSEVPVNSEVLPEYQGLIFLEMCSGVCAPELTSR